MDQGPSTQHGTQHRARAKGKPLERVGFKKVNKRSESVRRDKERREGAERRKVQEKEKDKGVTGEVRG